MFLVSRTYLVNLMSWICFQVGFITPLFPPEMPANMWALILTYLNVGPISWFILRQIDRDCEFLEGERIMDYSLLIGIHFRDDCSVNEMKMFPFDMQSGNFHHNLIQISGEIRSSFNCCIVCFFRQKRRAF